MAEPSIESIQRAVLDAALNCATARRLAAEAREDWLQAGRAVDAAAARRDRAVVAHEVARDALMQAVEALVVRG